MNKDCEFQTIHAVHQALNQKRISLSEWIQRFLSMAQRDRSGVYLTLCEERVWKHVKILESLLTQAGQVPNDRFPLFGIPLGVKDLLHIEGVRTTCGSKMLENYRAPYTATAITRLEAAGALVLGKTNMDEFAMGSSNENSAYGPVCHPTHPDRVPGGSSGGSAAGVRANLCFAALGTDTGGSVRLPASYCGIVGLKPSYGRISRWGQVAFASSLDQIGPMTRSVEDAALLLDVMSGYDEWDSTTARRSPTQTFQALQLPVTDLFWKNLKIGIPQEYFVGGLAPAVEKAIQAAIQWFQSKGVQFVSVSLPHTADALSVYYLIAVSEASSNLARFDGVRFGVRPSEISGVKNLSEFYACARTLLGPEVKRRILLGTFALLRGYSQSYYQRACQVRSLIQRDFQIAFEGVDLIVGPVSPTTAFRLGEKNQDPLQMYLNDLFTIPVNLAGLPAISLPCGQDLEGLPIGLQLIAPRFQEDRLLSVSHAFMKREGM